MSQSKDPAKAARQRQNLLKGVSADPATRARQIAKLQRGRPVVHGAQGGEKLEAARTRHDRELQADYPQFDQRRRALLADRLARVELAGAFIARNGIGPRSPDRRGEVWPIADRLEVWACHAERLLAAAEAQRGTSVENLSAYIERTYGTDEQ